MTMETDHLSCTTLILQALRYGAWPSNAVRAQADPTASISKK